MSSSPLRKQAYTYQREMAEGTLISQGKALSTYGFVAVKAASANLPSPSNPITSTVSSLLTPALPLCSSVCLLYSHHRERIICPPPPAVPALCLLFCTVSPFPLTSPCFKNTPGYESYLTIFQRAATARRTEQQQVPTAP